MKAIKQLDYHLHCEINKVSKSIWYLFTYDIVAQTTFLVHWKLFTEGLTISPIQGAQNGQYMQ